MLESLRILAASRAVVLVLSAAFLAAPAAWSQDTPAPPKPAETAPSLEVTMKYIEDRLNTVDSSFVWQTGNILESTGDEISSAKADISTCTLTFHQRHRNESDHNGSGIISTFNRDQRLRFRDVKTVQVVRLGTPPGSQIVLDIRMAEGKTVHVYNAATDSELKRTTGNVHRQSAQADSQEQGASLFMDEELANRLTKAMTRAVELCGGGDRDPFK